MNVTNVPSVDIDAIVRQAEIVELAMQRAVAEELLMHKKLGHSVVLCEDDIIRLVPPEEIEVDDAG